MTHEHEFVTYHIGETTILAGDVYPGSRVQLGIVKCFECGEEPKQVIADLERKLADTKASLIAYRDDLAATDEQLEAAEKRLALSDAVVKAAREWKRDCDAKMFGASILTREIYDAVAALDAREEA